MTATLRVGNFWHRARQGPLATWTPALLPNLISYVDFENNSKITPNAGGIAQIIDSANAAIIWQQATAGAQPRIVNNTLTGRQVGQCDGIGMFLAPAAFPASFPLSGAQEWWFVGTQEAVAGDGVNRTMVSFGTTNASTMQMLRIANTNFPRLQIGDGVSIFSSSAGAMFGKAAFRGRYDGASVLASLNGVDGSSTPGTYNGSGTRARLGAAFGAAPAAFWQGGISALVGVTGVMSNSDVNNMMVWAAQRLGLAASPFQPTDLGSALACYFDFENNAKIVTSAGPVVQSITDTQTVNAVAQATAGLRPALGISAATGRQVAKFTGTEFLELAPVPAAYPVTGAMEMWMVGTQDAVVVDPVNRRIPFITGQNATILLGLSRVQSSGAFQFRTETGAGASVSPGVALTTPCQGKVAFRGTWDGTNSSIFGNGVPGTTVAVSQPNDRTRIRIGASNTAAANGQWIGDISACLIFNRPLTVSEANSMYVWAAQRLGLAT